MGVSGAVSAPGTSSLPRHRKLDLTRWCLVPQLLPASCTRFCPTHQIHASLYSSISNRELWHKDIRLRQKASWGFMRWGPTTGQCQAQGAMLWIIVRPSCQVPEGEQKGIFFFFLWPAFLCSRKNPGDPRGFHLQELLVPSREQVTSPPAPPAALLFMLAFPLSFGYVCMTLCPQNMSGWCTVEEWHNFYQGEI